MPWIVVVTAIPWVPIPGQLANGAAGVALLAAACAPLERYLRSYHRRVPTNNEFPTLRSPTRAAAHNQRRWPTNLARAATLTLIIVVAGGVLNDAAGSARIQRVIVVDSLRTQQRGATALAYGVLAPAGSGRYEPRKFTIYFLLSGWALDLHDSPAVARLSLDLLKAAAAGRHPRSLVAGLSQYEAATQHKVPGTALSQVIAAAPAGPWRGAVQLLLLLPGHAANSRFETVAAAVEARLPAYLRKRFFEASILLQEDIAAGAIYP